MLGIQWDKHKLQALLYYTELSANHFQRVFEKKLGIKRAYFYKLLSGEKNVTRLVNLRVNELCYEVLQFSDDDFENVVLLSEMKLVNVRQLKNLEKIEL